MTIKEVFEKAENGTLTFEQFQEMTKDAKFVDVKEGGYVSKNKYDADLAAKDTEINTLNETVATRDTDLQTLQTKLSEAGTDAEKLNSLSGEFESLKTKYEEDTKAYQQKLDKQAYEFAVKEYANSKEFSSSAAKRDFISSMINENLKMKKDGSCGVVSPCGLCRYIFSKLQLNMNVIVPNGKSLIKVKTKDLLPYAYVTTTDRKVK